MQQCRWSNSVPGFALRSSPLFMWLLLESMVCVGVLEEKVPLLLLLPFFLATVMPPKERGRAGLPQKLDHRPLPHCSSAHKAATLCLPLVNFHIQHGLRFILSLLLFCFFALGELTFHINLPRGGGGHGFHPKRGSVLCKKKVLKTYLVNSACPPSPRIFPPGPNLALSGPACIFIFYSYHSENERRGLDPRDMLFFFPLEYLWMAHFYFSSLLFFTSIVACLRICTYSSTLPPSADSTQSM